MEGKREFKHLRAARWLGGSLVTIVGCLLVSFNLGDALARLSYDLPFKFRHSPPISDLVLVFVDDHALETYGGHEASSLDRRVQDRFLKKLTAEHARLVFYDLVFDLTNQPPEVDEAFGRTIASNGSVVLGATEKDIQEAGRLTTRIFAPVPVLRAGAKWGLIDLDFDPDTAVRKLPSGTTNYPSAVWVAAQMLGATVAQHPESRRAKRWLNYYGRPRTQVIPYLSFEHALEPAGVPAGSFAGKIVIVCSRSSAPVTGQVADEFANPYSRFGDVPAPGAEIHATALLNLLRHEWLTRLPFGCELLLVGVLGMGLGLSLTRLQPWTALGLAVGFAGVVTAAAFCVQWRLHLWWSWMVPVAIQAPVATVWAVGARYVLETRKRLRLRRAFAMYLSPEMADQISHSDFDLALGGKVLEVTVMFTDLEGFTAISESLGPDQVSHLLTAYFNQTSKTVLERRGTIIKYIGDSIMAVWGAPIADPGQAQQAVHAAWEMVQAGHQEIVGRKLRTRVGIHSGPALAGNLGSDLRFDYTVIGDTTNCASRLESANKHFGTEMLISEATRRQLDGQILTRRLGLFRLAGRAEPVEIHEVLGPRDGAADAAPWVGQFGQAVGCFCSRQWDQANRLFLQVVQSRGGADGPSQLYLAQIESVTKTLRPEDPWNGVIELTWK